MNLVPLIAMIVLYACGIYLMLERSFTRMILGILLAGNATNLLIFITSGDFGDAPVIGDDGVIKDTYSDPLPQAFILTAIVISFATLAFMLALLYRSWRLVRVDTVADDEDSVSLRHVDPEADDEVFEEGEGPDTEFGELAEAAVVGALTEEELGEEFAIDRDETDRDASDQGAPDRNTSGGDDKANEQRKGEGE